MDIIAQLLRNTSSKLEGLELLMYISNDEKKLREVAKFDIITNLVSLLDLGWSVSGKVLVILSLMSAYDHLAPLVYDSNFLLKVKPFLSDPNASITILKLAQHLIDKKLNQSKAPILIMLLISLSNIDKSMLTTILPILKRLSLQESNLEHFLNKQILEFIISLLKQSIIATTTSSAISSSSTSSFPPTSCSPEQREIVLSILLNIFNSERIESQQLASGVLASLTEIQSNAKFNANSSPQEKQLFNQIVSNLSALSGRVSPRVIEILEETNNSNDHNQKLDMVDIPRRMSKKRQRALEKKKEQQQQQQHQQQQGGSSTSKMNPETLFLLYQNMLNSLALGKQKLGMKTHNNVFSGKDCTNWLTQCHLLLPSNREFAVQTGEELRSKGYIYCVNDRETKFIDSSLFYYKFSKTMTGAQILESTEDSTSFEFEWSMTGSEDAPSSPTTTASHNVDRKSKIYISPPASTTNKGKGKYKKDPNYPYLSNYNQSEEDSSLEEGLPEKVNWQLLGEVMDSLNTHLTVLPQPTTKVSSTKHL